VYGGSIFNIPKSIADHYFILDGSIYVQRTPYYTIFPIPNFGVPKNIKLFNQCLEKAASFVNERCPIFVGCLGAHGRTGLFLSILLFQLTKDRLSLYTLRKVYCNKAVETLAQYKFLMDYGLEVYPLDYEQVKEKEEYRRKIYGKKSI